MESETTQPVPELQTTRSRSRCECGSPCFYCGRTLACRRHEHDHFPIPARHGGQTTVPACIGCHDLKDRTLMPGLYRDGSINELVLRSITEGMDGLPEAISAETGDRVPFVVWSLNDRAADWLGAPRLDWHGDDWLVDEVESFARLVVTSARAATTPEARIFIAWLFAKLLDIVDRGLLVGHA